MTPIHITSVAIIHEEVSVSLRSGYHPPAKVKWQANQEIEEFPRTLSQMT